MTVYGIKNCNTVKKALAWLHDHHVEYEFHDYKAKGITGEKLKGWSKQVGWQELINRKGTTWRQLDEKVKVGVTNQSAAVKLMSEKPTVIRRPLIEEDGKVVFLGFEEEGYNRHFA
ncbi:MAG TPA: ArsC family reductase [Cyclobacteriaceae bacterium]|nr:ArsC family reductase [Cyclobacteriaceae bacterium]